MSRQCNLSAKELGLECPWVNNDHFPALVSGAEFAPEWACVLVAITFKVTEPEEQRICIRFYVKLIIRLCKLLGWLWRLQLWATGDWQLHHNNVTPHASRLLQSFFVKHQITQVTQLHYRPNLAPCNFWLSPKLRSPLKGTDFRPLVRFRKIRQGSW